MQIAFEVVTVSISFILPIGDAIRKLAHRNQNLSLKI